MKRKAFIQKISFVGVGLSLSPWKLLSARTSTQTFNLPRATVHIPHGNFATSEFEKLVIPEFGLECTVQQFMRNGISESDDDLKVFSFQRKDEWLQISIARNGQAISDGKISGLNVRVDSFESSFFAICKN